MEICVLRIFLKKKKISLTPVQSIQLTIRPEVGSTQRHMCDGALCLDHLTVEIAVSNSG